MSWDSRRSSWIRIRLVDSFLGPHDELRFTGHCTRLKGCEYFVMMRRSVQRRLADFLPEQRASWARRSCSGALAGALVADSGSVGQVGDAANIGSRSQQLKVKGSTPLPMIRRYTYKLPFGARRIDEPAPWATSTRSVVASIVFEFIDRTQVVLEDVKADAVPGVPPPPGRSG